MLLENMLPAVETFSSSSLMINIVDESRKTNRHKIERLFFIPLNIGGYNIKLPRIYSLAKA